MQWETPIYSARDERSIVEVERRLGTDRFTAPLFNALVSKGIPGGDLARLICWFLRFDNQPAYPRRKTKQNLITRGAPHFKTLIRHQKKLRKLAGAYAEGSGEWPFVPVFVVAYEKAATALEQAIGYFRQHSTEMQSNADKAFQALVGTIRRKAGGKPRDPEVACLLEVAAATLFAQLGKEESAPEYTVRNITTRRRRLEKPAASHG